MEARYADYLDFYQRGPHSAHLVEHRSAGSTPVRLLSIRQPAGHYPDPPTGDLTVQLFTRGTVGAEADCGAGRFRFRTGPGVFGVAPHDSAGDYLLDGGHELLILAVPFQSVKALLDELSPGFGGDFGRLHAETWRDPLVEMICRRMWTEAAAASPRGRLFADSALVALLTSLMRLGEVSQKEGCATTSPSLRLALDYMQAHVDEDIALADLAGVAGLSPVHFARAFKTAVGVPPHQHLLRLRVQRARTLLAGTDLPIAEIALDCAFCHQGHLTTVFRRIMGVTPGAYRKAMRR